MKHNLSPAFLKRRKSQQGQSVLIALAVLFLLGFLGALFSIIVVRNLSNANAQTATQTTDYFAQAGISYANNQLETSPQGADWRPPLQYKWTSAGTPSYLSSSTDVAYTSLQTPPAQDPDFQWITAGFTRYNLNGGRFLIRVTYDPAAAINGPDGKYIKIESVGRLGTVDPNDPTTFTNAPPDFRRSELVAYKPIGIVDYSRFITNKDNRTDTATLGVPSQYESGVTTPFGPTYTGVATPGVYDFPPLVTAPTNLNNITPFPIITTYGSTTAYNSIVNGSAGGGGTLRSNMNLRLYGENNVYLNTTVGDDWEVAGNIFLDQYNPTTAANNYNQLPAQCTVYTPASGATPNNSPLSLANTFIPSNDPTTDGGFNTFGGAVRDGSSSSDAYGYPRSIKRLNPPIIDNTDAATGLTRYEALTNEQEVQIQQTSQSTSDYLPATVYINNSTDIQNESPNAVGGSSLRDEWLNTSGKNWNEGFYSPPATSIVIGPYSDTANYNVNANAPTGTTVACPYVTNQFGIMIHRDDGVPFTEGGTNKQAGESLFLTYGSLKLAGGTTSATNPVGPDAVTGATNVNPTGTALGYLAVAEPTTSATKYPAHDAVIYASGNVRIRGVVGDPSFAPVHLTIVTNGIAYIDGSILKGSTDSSISIIARQYVCVNTSQFLAGAPDYSASSSTLSNTGQYLTFTTSDQLIEHILFGSQYTAPTTTPSYNFYLSQSTSSLPQTSQGDIFVNGTQLAAVPQANVSTPTNEVIPLTTAPLIQSPFQLTFNKDSTAAGDWTVERAAILPSDIHIEAVLYAQDNSFFVIPGDWFNPNASDSLANFSKHSSTTNDPNGDFPFYGQPIDMQITIDGAISENVPADISDQAAWMQKWGWIPRYHGSDVPGGGSPHASGSGIATPQVGVGLNIIYDYNAGYPYTSAGASVNGTYLRQDRFGRPLPFSPALPVSPDLLYSGQPPS